MFFRVLFQPLIFFSSIRKGIYVFAPLNISIGQVDVLVKLQGQKRLTKKFLCEIKNIWNTCEPLTKNDYFTLSNLVKNALKVIKIEDYKKLDYYGEYPVDFLFVLMLLLSIQEKTNRIDAYMFGSIIDELLESNYDIFRIVSKAGYSGRK